MANQYEKYHQYTVADFLLDDSFLLWIKQPSSEQDAYWKELQQTYPSLAGIIADARELAAALHMKKDSAPDAVKDRIWNNVTASTGKTIAMKRAFRWIAAAAIILIIGSVSVFQYLRNGDEQVSTAYGEKRSLTLPDGSLVVLNANTQISYNPRPGKHALREVWINGEAWFRVVHINKAGTLVQPSDRFIVHLQHMDVEVLGTTFTVNTRRNHEQVVLQTGRVKVELKSKPSAIYLQPGELASYNKDSKVLSKATTTHPDDCSLWKENRLKFDNTPLREIIKLIEDDYGYKVEVKDSTLLDRTLGGTLSSENQQILFKALENMLDVKITTTDQTITISK